MKKITMLSIFIVSSIFLLGNKKINPIMEITNDIMEVDKEERIKLYDMGILEIPNIDVRFERSIIIKNDEKRIYSTDEATTTIYTYLPLVIYNDEKVIYNTNYGDIISIPIVGANDANYIRFFVNEKEIHKTNSSKTYIKLRENLKPAISGIDSILNNIDDPYDLKQIKKLANLKAYDEYDGEITDRITILRDNYTKNASTVGEYKIVFEVINKSDMKAQYELTIINRDVTGPKISEAPKTIVNYKETVDLEGIKELYKVTDSSNDIEFSIRNTDYISNTKGEFILELVATDKYGNETTRIHFIDVIDNIKPEFRDNSSNLLINFKEEITRELLLKDLVVVDEYDGELTNDIKITENNMKNDIGFYTVKYEVKDKSGNTSIYERKYQVVSDSEPYFLINKNLLKLKEIMELTKEEVLEQLRKQNEFLNSINTLK